MRLCPADCTEEDLHFEQREPDRPQIQEGQPQEDITAFPSTGIVVKSEEGEGGRTGTLLVECKDEKKCKNCFQTDAFTNKRINRAKKNPSLVRG